MLTKRLQFELGAIAHECLTLYLQAGNDHYASYRPQDMLMRTNHLFNFIDEYAFDFGRGDFITLKDIWSMYKAYCEEVGIKYRLNMNHLRDELKAYWEEFYPQKRMQNTQYRSVFVKFKKDVFHRQYREETEEPEAYDWLEMDYKKSIFDTDQANQKAQLANTYGVPNLPWEDVKTTLSDIDTSKLHYVLPKFNLITIDLDIKEDGGAKSLALNKEAARIFPSTYAEVSRGGEGLHLHYFYEGDVAALSRLYDVNIEIVRPVGNTSIRRKLSICNGEPISTLSGGLPLKPEKKGDRMVSNKTIGTERALRRMIARNLLKEYHHATKPSVDFIYILLEEAHNRGLRYDVSDMRSDVTQFASNSTNNSAYCLDLVSKMEFPV